MRSRSVISCIVFGFAIAASTAALAQDKPPEGAPPTGTAPETAPGEKPPEPGAAPTATTTATAPAPEAPPPTTAPEPSAPPAAAPPPAAPPATTTAAPAAAPVTGPAYSPQNPPPSGDTGTEEKKSEPPPESAVGLQLDFGVIGRLDSGADFEKGGYSIGPSAWVSPMRLFAVGLGYQRVRAGVDRTENAVGGLDVQHDMDLLWVFGRGYPYRTDSFGVYVTLGFGGAWQHVNASGAQPTTGLVQPATPYSCSGSAGPAFAIGGGAGLDLDVGRDWSFITEADLTTFRNSGDSIGSCTAGTGPMTGLGARVGFAYRFDLGNGPAKTARAHGSTRL